MGQGEREAAHGPAAKQGANPGRVCQASHALPQQSLGFTQRGFQASLCLPPAGMLSAPAPLGASHSSCGRSSCSLLCTSPLSDKGWAEFPLSLPKGRSVPRPIPHELFVRARLSPLRCLVALSGSAYPPLSSGCHSVPRSVLRLNTEGRSKRGSQGRGRPWESQDPCLQVSTRRAWTVTAAGMGRASCALHLHPGCREDSLR